MCFVQYITFWHKREDEIAFEKVLVEQLERWYNIQ